MSGADAWTDRRILVTGAAGFLGGRLAAEVAHRGARVVGLDRRPSSSPAAIGPLAREVVVDLREASELDTLLADEAIEIVFHLAAETIVADCYEHPTRSFESNIAGTWTVLDACRRCARRPVVVVASSDKAYGDASGAPYEEQTPLRPRHPYDVSKACADMLAQTYASSYGMAVGITRCANIYGGGDLNWSRLLPGTIRAALQGERPVIRSDGTPVRDYLYVEDAIDGLLALALALEQQPALHGEAFNFASGDRLSVRAVVGRVLALTGLDIEPDVQNSAKHEISEQRVDAGRAAAALSWFPKYPLTAGLAKTVEWYRHHLGL